jgi:hypothetical protein
MPTPTFIIKIPVENSRNRKWTVGAGIELGIELRAGLPRTSSKTPVVAATVNAATSTMRQCCY